MNLRFIIFQFLFLLIGTTAFTQQPPVVASTPFEIEDLVSLYNAGEIDEFLKHAKDIRPAVRGPKWRAMVTEFAKKKVEQTLALPIASVGLEDIIKIEEYLDYTHHLSNIELQSRRLELGYAFLDHALQKISSFDSNKILEIKRWWEKHWSTSLKNPLVAYKYAKLFDSYSPLSKFESTNLLAFFENQESLNIKIKELLKVTYKSGLSKDLCQDPWVWNHLWEHIKEIMSVLKKSDQGKMDLKLFENFSLGCWESARSLLLVRLNNMTSDNKHFAIHLLSLDRTLDLQNQTFIHLYYLLFEPHDSPLYKSSLETLLKLSLSQTFREQLLKQFMALDPLPGAVFSQASTEAYEVLLRLTRSFPEYVDGYAQTCYDYLSGARQFLNGNPTPECLDFCKSYVRQKVTFFEKPVYKLIQEKFMGQCPKP